MLQICEGKQYKLFSSFEFDKFMQRLGVEPITREAANDATPTVELRKNGDYYVLKTTSTFKTMEIRFKEGEEFQEKRADGIMVRSVCTFEGNKLVQVQRSPGGMRVVYIREFEPHQMTATMTAEDVTCKRVYRAQ